MQIAIKTGLRTNSDALSEIYASKIRSKFNESGNLKSAGSNFGRSERRKRGRFDVALVHSFRRRNFRFNRFASAANQRRRRAFYFGRRADDARARGLLHGGGFLFDESLRAVKRGGKTRNVGRRLRRFF